MLAIPQNIPPVNSIQSKYPKNRPFARYQHRSESDAQTDGSRTSTASFSRTLGANLKCKGSSDIRRPRGIRLQHHHHSTLNSIPAKRENNSARSHRSTEQRSKQEIAVSSKPLVPQRPVFNTQYPLVRLSAVVRISNHSSQPFPTLQNPRLPHANSGRRLSDFYTPANIVKYYPCQYGRRQSRRRASTHATSGRRQS